MEKTTDRRFFRRINANFDVRLVPNTDLVFDWDCESIDLSEGGIKVLSTREPIPGYEVEVIFTLPEKKARLAIQSEVVWTGPSNRIGRYFAGIRYNELSEIKRRELRQFLYSGD